MRKLFAMFTLLALVVLPGCGYNEFQTKDEQVKAAWAEVLTQHDQAGHPAAAQRRAAPPGG